MKRKLAALCAALICLAGFAAAEESMEPVSALTITGGMPYEHVLAYQAQYPGAAVEFAEVLSAEEIAQRMVSQDGAIDLYVVEADYTFHLLKEKGYVAPLSSQAIAEAVAAMDETIRAVLCDGAGQVVAWPESIYIQYYGINEGYWNMLWPDVPLPQTFGEVLEAWIDWERNYQQDFQGVGFMGANFDYANWVERLVRAYVMHSGNPLPDMDAPALKDALEQLREIYEIRLSLGRTTTREEVDPLLVNDSETGPGAVFSMPRFEAMHSFDATPVTNSAEILYGVPKNGMTWLPMRFTAEQTPRTHAQMRVYIVNPYSQNREQAMAYLACVAQRETDVRLYCALHPEATEPCEKPGYAAQREEYEQMSELYAQAIEEAQAAGEDPYELEVKLAYYQEWLQNDNNRYLLSANTIHQYWATLAEAPLDFHLDSPCLGAMDTGASGILTDACERYAAGNLGLDAFLRELETRMEMAHRENLT